ncbi:MAG: S9 family peptidase [Planctomycetota bacterium]|jgi:dipeptidyl aminopeptidase/acylaminoacyl peptidase
MASPWSSDWQVRESEIYKIAVDTGAITQLTSRKGPDGGPIVSPDGKLIAYSGHDANRDSYNIPTIHVMGIDGSDPRVLNAGMDRRVGGMKWGANSKEIFFTVSSEGSRNLHKVDLSGHASQITSGAHNFNTAEISKTGMALGTLASAHAPGDIAMVALANPTEIKKLTAVNDDLLSRVELGDVEEIWYESAGMRVQGWVITPPDFDPSKKYPLILQIHGGPHSMYGVEFNFERQNHAAEDYVVLYTNPRGSVGYGKEFGNAINNAYPSQDYDDLMNGVDEVIKKGFIDESKLFVYGGSGGGVLTAWIVGHTDRFAGAVSMFPVINWISFVGTTDGPYWYTNFKDLPWESIDEHWDRSPLKYVGNVTTPTMLITGELDLRTPMAQTEEYYQALKLRKVKTAMVRIPDEYHGAAGRHFSNALRRILYVRGWFEESIKDRGEAVEAGMSRGSR